MPIPAFQNFDIANAVVTVWLYKKSAGVGGIPRYTGRWIDTDQELDQALRSAVAAKRASILELQEYGLLANPEDGQALRLGTIETYAQLIVEQTAAELAAKKATTLKQVQNTDFYVVKLVHGDDVIHAVRRTDPSWRAKKKANWINVLFEDEQLGLDTTPAFNISRDVDFFIVGDDLVIGHKKNFESVLSYKEAHATDFTELQAEPAFIGIFADIAPLVQYVGSNKLHLRRACAIRIKGHYANLDFMARLHQNYQQYGLDLVFDEQGRLIATDSNCADVITALLDHRLFSVFSETVYDVPNAVAVP